MRRRRVLFTGLALAVLIGFLVVAVPAAAALVKPHLDPAKNPLVNFATPETRALNQKQEEDIRERITGYDRRLADLDAMGIDFQLVMPPPPQCYYTVPIEIAVKAARIVNDGVAEFVAKMPDRFAGLGRLAGAERQRQDSDRQKETKPRMMIGHGQLTYS